MDKIETSHSLLKQGIDLSSLYADAHLTKQERDIMNDITKNYEQNKEKLVQATKGELKNFITKDYGEANRQYLGGFEGIIELQKALKIEPSDGVFGPETFHAVIDFQRKYGMKPDGIAGQGVQDRLGLIKDKYGIVRKVKATQESNGTDLKNSDKREFGRARVSTTTKSQKPETSTDAQKANPLIVGKIYTVKNLAISLQSDTYKDPELHKTWKEVSAAMAFAGSAEEYDLERFQNNRYKALNSAIKNLDATMQGIDASTPEYKYYLEVRASLIDLNMAWRKSGMSGGEKATAALKGMGIGAYETVKGVFDITLFVGSLPFSPERQELVGKIWKKISVACSTAEERVKAWNLFKEAVTKFYVEKLSVNSTMQPDEQAELGGKIFSYVMGGVGIGKGVVTLTEKAISKGGKVVQAEEMLGKLATRGEVSGVRMQKIQVLQNQAQLARLGYKTLSVVLNGVVESAIGTSLMKTCKGVVLVLASTKEIPEKIAAVKNGLKQINTELQNQNLSLEQKSTITEIQTSLEGELRNLEGNGILPHHPEQSIYVDGVEVIPKNTSGNPKKVHGDIVDVKFTMIPKEESSNMGTESRKLIGHTTGSQNIPLVGKPKPDRVDDLYHDMARKIQESQVPTETMPSKKQFENLINPENYEKELAILRTKKANGEITQREYREGQKELIMERALQRSNEMFLEGERILRSHPDIKPDEMVQLLREHFKANDVQLSHLQEAMINSTSRVLQEAIDIRQKNLKIYFDLAGKQMPEKMEDVQRMLNEDLDVGFEVWKKNMDLKIYADIQSMNVSSANKDILLQQSHQGFNQAQYQKAEKITFDIISHPTVIIQNIPNSLWFIDGGVGGYLNGKIFIRLGDNGSMTTKEILEHEYTHFLNGLNNNILESAHFSEAYRRSGRVSPNNTMLQKIAGRIGKDAWEEGGVTNSIGGYSREKDWISEKMLWNRMQDELLAYLKANKIIPAVESGISPFLNGLQKNLLSEGKISVLRQNDMISLQNALFHAKNTFNIPDEKLLEIIRTSGNIQLVYERLIKSFPEQTSMYPKTWDEYRKWVLQTRINGVEKFETVPGVRVINEENGGFIIQGKGKSSTFNLDATFSQLSDNTDKLEQVVKSYGSLTFDGIIDNPRILSDFLSQKIGFSIGTEGYFLWSNDRFRGIVEKNTNRRVEFTNIDEFIEGLRKFKQNPELLFPKEVSGFGSEVDAIIANGEKHTEKVIAELDGNFQAIKNEIHESNGINIHGESLIEEISGWKVENSSPNILKVFDRKSDIPPGFAPGISIDTNGKGVYVVSMNEEYGVVAGKVDTDIKELTIQAKLKTEIKSEMKQKLEEELGKHFGSHGAIDDWEDIFGKLKVQKDGDVIYENGIVSRGKDGIVETIQHEGVILDFDKNGKVNDVIGGTALQLDDGSIEVTLKNGSKKVIPHEFIIGKKNS